MYDLGFIALSVFFFSFFLGVFGVISLRAQTAFKGVFVGLQSQVLRKEGYALSVINAFIISICISISISISISYMGFFIIIASI